MNYQRNCKKMKETLIKKSLSPVGAKHMKNARNAVGGAENVKLGKKAKLKSMRPGLS
jgi:hypothetical protein